MKRTAIISAIVTSALAATATAGWAPSVDYLVRRDMKFFEGKTPEQIARFLTHHNGIPCSAAVRSLAAHGKEALPLLKKLLGDTNPWMRSGAINVLTEMHKVADKPGRKEDDAREITPELQDVLTSLTPLMEDDHPAVLGALGSFLSATRIDMPATRKLVLAMASSDDPSVRGRAVRASSWLKDANTVIDVCAAVSAAPHGNSVGHYRNAHKIVHRYKDDPVCRRAIPAMAYFLRHEANTRPHRGFFTDGIQFRALEVFKAQWDAEIEAIPDVVPGIARCYVRVPINDYAGWVKTRALALGLLEKLSPKAAPALRKTIAEEKKWLAEVDSSTIVTVVEAKMNKARPVLTRHIAKLEEIAAKLERQKKTGNSR